MSRFLLIAGPCVIESEENVMLIADKMKRIAEKLDLDYYFKASFDKANRTSIHSYRGPGMEKGLEILKKVKEVCGLRVCTDIHEPWQAEKVSEVADILQIPAFLCRQTDLLVAAARTGKAVNIKKGQFLAPESMRFAVDKVRSAGCADVAVTDRGSQFGYGDLIVDFRGIPQMQKQCQCPVILDITHSLQQPNQGSGVTGGRPDMIETIARAGIAVGADGLFIETHPDPSVAKSDGANMLRLDLLENLLTRLVAIRRTINEF